MRGMINLLGPLFTRAFKPGASEVKQTAKFTASDSSTRVTLLTPTSGKKVRVISVLAGTGSATGTNCELYFGTGAQFTTDVSKAIFIARLDNDIEMTKFLSWPDGGGPVGAVDEVVSMRTNDNITSSVVFMVHYREE